MLKIFTHSLFFILIFSRILSAQDSTQSSPLSFSGYVDAYGAYYTDSVGVDNYQKFPTVSPRSKQIGLNIAMITGTYDADRVRGVITLQYGDIPKSSWSSTYNFIQEAHAGIRITKDLWFDGGFFRSHIGCEGLLPIENITSSISVPTFYEPYYEAGFRLNYIPTDKLTLNLYVLNGYNLYEDNNDSKSGGLLASYAFNDNTSLTYCNYFGDDSPEEDSLSKFRFFNNIYVNSSINKFKIVAGLDFGVQENSSLTDTNGSATMWSGILAVAFKAAKKFTVYTRGEIYQDPDGILSGVFINSFNDYTGLKLWGVTFGAEFKPTDNSYIRLEARNLTAADSQDIFHWDNINKDNRFETTLDMGVTFP